MADESVRLQLMVIDVDIAELEVEIVELKERLDWLTTDGQDPNLNDDHHLLDFDIETTEEELAAGELSLLSKKTLEEKLRTNGT